MLKKGWCFAIVLGWLSASASAQDLTREDTTETGPVIVTGQDTSVYGAPDSVTGTKTDTPILDVPQTIVVVPRELIDDQNDQTLESVLNNVPGVSTGGPYRDFDEYRLRGFDANGHTFVDGLTVDTELNFQEELFGLDRVEVIEGPASVLYGQGVAGGLVNLISKTAVKGAFTNFTLEGGSYGEFEAGVDTDAPLNASGSVNGRIVLAYHQIGESAEDVPPSRRLFFAPSMTIDLTSSTKITLLGQFYEEWQNLQPPLPAVGTVLPDANGEVSIYRNIGEPDTYPFRLDARRVQLGYQFESRLNEIFTLRENLRLGLHKALFQGILISGLEPDERTLERFTDAEPDVYQTLQVDTTLVAKFAPTPWMNHTALVGVDFYYFHDRFKDIEGVIAPIDIFQPTFGARPYDFVLDDDTLTDTYATGLYFQDQIELFHRVTIVAGGREDFVINDLHDYLGDADQGRTDEAFSPRAGIVYEMIPATFSSYFSWSRSFLSNPYDQEMNGEPLPPERGEEYEVGLKADAFAGRLTGLLALYDITRSNIPTPDEANPNFFNSIGEERHRGVDLNVTCQPKKGWNLTASYSYIDARVTKDDQIPSRVGNQPNGVPEDTFSIWTRYTLQRGPWRGFGAGAGFRYVTRQEGDEDNTFVLPAYGLLNVALYYERGRFKGQLNVNNATDQRYYPGSYDRYFVQAGTPLSVFSNVEWGF